MGLDFILTMATAALPNIVAAVSPKVTEFVKKGANAVAGYTVKLPAVAKVLINAAVAAGVAGVAGSQLGFPLDVSLGAGAGTGLASSVGFAVGRKS